jgi:hypothetical protein
LAGRRACFKAPSETFLGVLLYGFGCDLGGRGSIQGAYSGSSGQGILSPVTHLRVSDISNKLAIGTFKSLIM